MTSPALRALGLASLAVLATACSQDVLEPAPFGPAAAVSTSAWADDFDAWDPARWVAGEHPLGQSMLRPENVSVAGGTLWLRSPAGTRDGAEVRSVDNFEGGTFTARMKCGLPAGAICAFFLYEWVPGNRNDEIDFEILAGTRRLMMTTWQRGRQTNHAEITLPFDPALDFHEYRIEWGSRTVSFVVDGQVMRTFNRRLPSRPMHVFANAWWPTWLSGQPATTDTFLAVDWISVGP